LEHCSAVEVACFLPKPSQAQPLFFSGIHVSVFNHFQDHSPSSKLLLIASTRIYTWDLALQT